MEYDHPKLTKTIAHWLDTVRGDTLAGAMFPTVSVRTQTNRHYVFDGESDDERGFTLRTAVYDATVRASHRDHHCDEMVAALEASADLIKRRDEAFARQILPAFPSGPIGCPWNNGGDPIGDIAAAQQEIIQKTGLQPDVLAVGGRVYKTMRKHPVLVDRAKFMLGRRDIVIYDDEEISLSPGMIAKILDLDDVFVDRGDDLLGDGALLAYRPKDPGIMVPSAGYIFNWSGLTDLNERGIRASKFALREDRGDRIELELAEDMKVVSRDLAYHFTGLV